VLIALWFIGAMVVGRVVLIGTSGISADEYIFFFINPTDTNISNYPKIHYTMLAYMFGFIIAMFIKHYGKHSMFDSQISYSNSFRHISTIGVWCLFVYSLQILVAGIWPTIAIAGGLVLYILGIAVLLRDE